MASSRPTDLTKIDAAAAVRERPDPYAPSREAPVDGAKPEEPEAPRARATYVVPLAIALAVFVILIVARMFWGGMESRHATSPVLPQSEATTPASPQPSQ